jgi:hypothetical protein
MEQRYEEAVLLRHTPTSYHVYVHTSVFPRPGVGHYIRGAYSCSGACKIKMREFIVR